jgi:hypothetical protein
MFFEILANEIIKKSFLLYKFVNKIIIIRKFCSSKMQMKFVIVHKVQWGWQPKYHFL